MVFKSEFASKICNEKKGETILSSGKIYSEVSYLDENSSPPLSFPDIIYFLDMYWDLI